MDIKFEAIKEILKEKKYIATDEIVWNVIKSIKKMNKVEQKGQDIYSICLEGPPGAGKSFYAKTYTKVLTKVFNEEVKFLEYSCDSTTGKAELYEEIRVAAAVANKPEEVIISGMLVEAIDAVNAGKKVVLLLDEFEKSRRETDSFMFQFLQDGKIKTTQRGIVEIKPEYKKNLQVILCKNDERELSDPLLRRNHIIRLEIMTPNNFLETVNMNLPECDEDIRNVVSLLYEKMYANKDDFAKFPSCSEGMLAIQDACDLYEEEAPVEVIYADILSNLLKHPDDIETFKIMMSKDDQLSNFVKVLQNNEKTEKNITVKDEIYQSFFSKEMQKISGMKKIYERNEKKYKELIENLRQQLEEMTRKNRDRIQQNNSLNERNTIEENKQEDNNMIEKKRLVNFEEDDIQNMEPVYVPTSIINRGDSIFDGSDNWYEIMKIEVEEEGWQAIEELIEEGATKSFLDFVIKSYSYESREKVLGGAPTWLLYAISEEAKLPQILENSICYDGIILKDTKNSDYIKLVAQKQIKEGKNYYKIFSNSKIQNKEVLSGNIPQFLVKCNHSYIDIGKLWINECEINNNSRGIGLFGLTYILGMKKIRYKINRNYLILSLGTIKEKATYKAYYSGDKIKKLEKCMIDNGIDLEEVQCDYGACYREVRESIKNIKEKNIDLNLYDYVDDTIKFNMYKETDIPGVYLRNEETKGVYYFENYDNEIKDKITDEIMGQKDQMELIKALSKCQISQKLLSKEQNNKEMDDEIEI